MGSALPRGKRQNDLQCKRGAIDRDRIRIHLPAGYTLENVPAPVSLDTEWGTFTATYEVRDGLVDILQEFKSKRFREGPDRFDDFRTFVRAIGKAYEGQIVLVRQ